jgi:hypothetical protein
MYTYLKATCLFSICRLILYFLLLYPSAKRSSKKASLHFAKFARELECSFMATVHRMRGRKVSNIAVIKLKWTDLSSTHTGESGNV